MAVVSVKTSIINKVSNSRERPLLSIMHRVKPSSYENMKGGGYMLSRLNIYFRMNICSSVGEAVVGRW